MNQVMTMGELVGQRVRDLRLQYGMSQAGLVHALQIEGSHWTRSSVAMLEAKGVRGERIGDLAALCAVFNLNLLNLLFDPEGRPSGKVEVRGMGPVKADWLLSALMGELAPLEPASDFRLGPQIGVDRPEVAERLAQSAGVDIDEMYEFCTDLSRRLGARDVSGPSGLRDWLANLKPDMPQSTIAAKRGHAARLLVWAAQQSTEEIDRWIAQRKAGE
jgi:transcriptional regulator with XRE-family HTH domain